MGRAAADSLAAEGVDLVLSARGGVRLEETARDLRLRYGVRVTAVAADHSTQEGRKLIAIH
jgi:3-oxoacyl-[acyl-carrier protein] reductase